MPMDISLFRKWRANHDRDAGDARTQSGATTVPAWLIRALWERGPFFACVRDEAGRTVYSSPQFQATFESAPREKSNEVQAKSQQLEQTSEGGGAARRIESLTGPDGKTRHVLMEEFGFLDPDGDRYTGVVGMDITEQKLHADEMTRLAMTDALTGLLNRRGFFFLAEHELRVARRRRTASAIIYVDVDHLKRVNDRYGHGEGDLLLQETAILLRSEFRDSDVIGRIGGDEFAVFASDVKDGAETLRELLWTLFRDFPKTGQQRAQLSLSVGVATWDPGEPVQLTRLMMDADRSLYEHRRRRRAVAAGA
jgi:diguanylate cyclase (GGDEF)-like protein